MTHQSFQGSSHRQYVQSAHGFRNRPGEENSFEAVFLLENGENATPGTVYLHRINHDGTLDWTWTSPVELATASFTFTSQHAYVLGHIDLLEENERAVVYKIDRFGDDVDSYEVESANGTNSRWLSIAASEYGHVYLYQRLRLRQFDYELAELQSATGTYNTVDRQQGTYRRQTSVGPSGDFYNYGYGPSSPFNYQLRGFAKEDLSQMALLSIRTDIATNLTGVVINSLPSCAVFTDAGSIMWCGDTSSSGGSAIRQSQAGTSNLAAGWIKRTHTMPVSSRTGIVYGVDLTTSAGTLSTYEPVFEEDSPARTSRPLFDSGNDPSAEGFEAGVIHGKITNNNTSTVSRITAEATRLMLLCDRRNNLYFVSSNPPWMAVVDRNYKLKRLVSLSSRHTVEPWPEDAYPEGEYPDLGIEATSALIAGDVALIGVIGPRLDIGGQGIDQSSFYDWGDFVCVIDSVADPNFTGTGIVYPKFQTEEDEQPLEVVTDAGTVFVFDGVPISFADLVPLMRCAVSPPAGVARRVVIRSDVRGLLALIDGTTYTVHESEFDVSDATFYLDGEAATEADMEERMRLQVFLDDADARLVMASASTPTYTGTIVSVFIPDEEEAEAGMLPTVTMTDGLERVLTVTEETRVTLDRVVSPLESLDAGMPIKYFASPPLIQVRSS